MGDFYAEKLVRKKNHGKGYYDQVPACRIDSGCGIFLFCDTFWNIYNFSDDWIGYFSIPFAGCGI